MKMFSKLMLSAVTLAGVSLGAAGAQSYSKVADYTSTTKFFSDTKEGFQCKSGEAKCDFRIFGKKHFPVEAGKKYKISYEYRNIPGGEESVPFFYFGLLCLDKAEKEIDIREVNAHKDTQTELAAPAKKGDTELKVKDASKWILRYAQAAFNAKADYSDLPNRELSPRIVKIEKTGDCWTLTLKTPMTQEYPAGTAVRNHADGATYRYVDGANKPQAQWLSNAKIFSGFSKSDSFDRDRNFRAGTAFIAPVIFPGGNGPVNIEFRNIKFEEVK